MYPDPASVGFFDEILHSLVSLVLYLLLPPFGFSGDSERPEMHQIEGRHVWLEAL